MTYCYAHQIENPDDFAKTYQSIYDCYSEHNVPKSKYGKSYCNSAYDPKTAAKDNLNCLTLYDLPPSNEVKCNINFPIFKDELKEYERLLDCYNNKDNKYYGASLPSYSKCMVQLYTDEDFDLLKCFEDSKIPLTAEICEKIQPITPG